MLSVLSEMCVLLLVSLWMVLIGFFVELLMMVLVLRLVVVLSVDLCMLIVMMCVLRMFVI